MQTKIETQPKATIKISITVENPVVKKTFEKILDKFVEETTLEGFRKGKAPRELVRDHIGINKLYGETINEVLQTSYPQALKENKIAPVANPKVEIKEFNFDKDLEFTATVAIRPEVKIGEFKSKVKEGHEKRQEELKKSNEEKLKKGEKIEHDHMHLIPNDIIQALLEVSELEISDILIDEETERMMSRLVQQAQTIGLSMDQYLKAQNKTADQLRTDYKVIAERNIKAEFILGKLIADQNIQVTDEEIEETIKAAGFEDPQKRMEDPMEKMYIKTILQKNKLLSSLIEELEGEHKHE